MRRLWLIALCSMGLAAQEKPAAPAVEVAPAAPESPLTGFVEVGVRWNQGVHGNLDTYRSIVNLGEGMRLLSWDLKLESAGWKALRRAQIRGAGWGGDPSSWLVFNAENNKYYRLLVDHRTTAYFHALPSYANPLLDRGIFTSQRSFDSQKRLTEVQLDLYPTARWIPYVGYTRDRGFGRGITDFVSDANEYPVHTNLSDITNLFRGGVRADYRHFHLTIEQGGILFRDDQSVFAINERNLGNRRTPFFGQTLSLSELLQAYQVRGSSIYSKGFLTATPADWLDLSGAIQFSRPRNDVTYNQNNKGQFVDLESLLFFNTQSIRLLAAASQPHVTANAGAEIRPFHRLRILESYMTDRLHNASTLEATPPVSDRLVWNYSQHQTEASFEVHPRLNLRGGYRYTWGDGRGRGPRLSQTVSESAELKRQTALLGLAFRVSLRASLNADAEIARSDKVLFRTSLSDYERLRMRGRYQFRPGFLLYGTLQYLNNSNPPGRSRYEFRSQQAGLGFQWTPGKSTQVIGEYTRSTIRSDLDYLAPQILQTQRSLYRENAHTVTGLFSRRLAVGWIWQPELSLGGSMFLSSGSRPASYYQPVARFSAPMWRRVDLIAEYRWYSVSQMFYLFEGFRSHLGFVGVRIH